MFTYYKEFITHDNKKIYRVSRWIRIKYNNNVSKRNSLYYYATDENGYTEGSSNFNPKNGLFLDYFTFHGKNYAINQFFRLDYPIFFDENGKITYLAGYDSENYYKPLLIELDDCAEYVRIYEEE